MIKRKEILQISEKGQENLEIADWAFQSHNWVEYHSGYYECKWCGKTHTSTMAISKDYPLCLKNPALKKILTKGKERMKVRKSVKKFAEEMEQTLQSNDHKGGWGKGKCTINFLEDKLYEEVIEWVKSKDPYELIDIANVCMMIFERRGVKK